MGLKANSTSSQQNQSQPVGESEASSEEAQEIATGSKSYSKYFDDGRLAGAQQRAMLQQINRLYGNKEVQRVLNQRKQQTGSKSPGIPSVQGQGSTQLNPQALQLLSLQRQNTAIVPPSVMRTPQPSTKQPNPKPNKPNSANQAAQNKQGGPKGTIKEDYLQIQAHTFAEAATIAAAKIGAQMKGEYRIIVMNGPVLKIFTNTGAAASPRAFRFRYPVKPPNGVLTQVPNDRYMHPLVNLPNGKLKISRNYTVTEQNIDFDAGIENFNEFKKAFGSPQPYFLVVPFGTTVERPSAATPDNPAPSQEELPEFMRTETKRLANTPAYEAEIIPLTPQLASVDSTGSYMMQVNKAIGRDLLDQVTNVAQPMSFQWQVLKLDAKDQIVNTRKVGQTEGIKEAYRRKARNADADRDTILGDNREQQGLLERGAREAVAEPLHDARLVLGVVGETVFRFVKVVAGGVNTFFQDVIEVPWKESGEYFVRCLATPIADKDAPVQRATSVAGAKISVYNIADMARESLPSVKQEQASDQKSLAELQQNRDKIVNNPDGMTEDDDFQVAEIDLLMPYLEERQAAGGDTRALLRAHLNYAQAQIAYLTGPDAHPPGWQERLKRLREDVRKDQEKMKRADSRLGTEAGTAKMMSGVLIDEATGVRQDLTFSIAEHIYVNTQRVEIRIADIGDSDKGRIVSGIGDTREEAWDEALRDLRKNLGHGRGWLSYRPPAPYDKLKTQLPNPMQLQVAALDQIHETVDDAVHVMTLVALLAAIPTGGASMGLLAVLAPIQAASSLYRLVDRAAYSTLELDSDAVSDLINIASFGLGHVGEAGQFSSKGVKMLYATNKVAIGLLELGGYAVMSYQTYEALMNVPEGLDPREARLQRLRALLNFFEGASIAIAGKLYAEAGMSRSNSKQAGQAHENNQNRSSQHENQSNQNNHPPDNIREGEHSNKNNHSEENHNQRNDEHGHNNGEGLAGIGGGEHTQRGSGHSEPTSSRPSAEHVQAVVEEIRTNAELRREIVQGGGDFEAIKRILNRTRNWRDLMAGLQSGTPQMKQVGRHILAYREWVLTQLRKFNAAPVSSASTEWISDVDCNVKGGQAGRNLLAAERWMGENVGQHWAEMLRMSFFTEAGRLTQYEQVQQHMSPTARQGMHRGLSNLAEVYNLALMLQHAQHAATPEARLRAIGEVMETAQALSLTQNQITEIQRLGQMSEATRQAIRDKLLPRIDLKVREFNRTRNNERRIQLAQEITTMQMEANFYTPEAYIGPGAGRQTVQGRSVEGHEAYQAALSHLQMFRHIIAEHQGNLVKAASEYELFKYVNRFAEAARSAGITGPELDFFENLSAYLYRVNRQAHSQDAHLNSPNLGEMRNKSKRYGSKEQGVPVPSDHSSVPVTPEFLDTITRRFLETVNETLPKMKEAAQNGQNPAHTGQAGAHESKNAAQPNRQGAAHDQPPSVIIDPAFLMEAAALENSKPPEPGNVGGVRGSTYELSNRNPKGEGKLKPRSFDDQIKNYVTPTQFKHGATLSRRETNQYTLTIPHPDGTSTPISVEVSFRLNPTDQMPPASSHQTEAGNKAGSARLQLKPPTGEPGGPGWRLEIHVDNAMRPEDVSIAIGHELQEACDIIYNRPNHTGPADFQGEMEAGVFQRGQTSTTDSPRITSHDRATAVELREMITDLTNLSRTYSRKAEGKEKTNLRNKVEARTQTIQRLVIEMGLDQPLNTSLKVEALRQANVPENWIEGLRKAQGQVEAATARNNLLNSPEFAALQVTNPALNQQTTIFTQELLQHMVLAEERTDFSNRGIYGGHVDSALHELVDNHPNLVVIQEGPVNNGYRQYSQYRYKGSGQKPPPGSAGYPKPGGVFDPNLWVRSNQPKTTSDNLNGFLHAAEDAWLRYMAANKPDPNATPRLDIRGATSSSGIPFNFHADYVGGHWQPATVYLDGSYIGGFPGDHPVTSSSGASNSSPNSAATPSSPPSGSGSNSGGN